MRTALALAVAVAVLAAGCATAPAPAARALEARVAAILERRGLGGDALGVIDNMLRHEGPLPPLVPELVRELLARPLGTLDAAAFFERALPPELQRLAEAFDTRPAPGPTVDARGLLEPYLRELAEAQRTLRAALHGKIDPVPILRELETRLPSASRLAAVAGAIDQEAFGRASREFLEATARFLRSLRSAEGRIRFPQQVERFESAIGTVVIGTPGDDHHGPAALILDPGGNDTYQPGLAIGAFSAIIDLAGNDRYVARGPGTGAAIAGVSVIVDADGDDQYEAGIFGVGAAAFGIGAILDLAGNDSYRVRAGGQGFGMTGGVGLVWDRSGDDRYRAAGLADAFDRGGGLSMAQGFGFGARTSLGGGIGVLRDDAGDDRYEAEMYAQGAAYFFGAGLLWDRAGDDRYSAVRYAQGCGVHQAIGILRDESGADRYALGVGVGQGMGLDQSVGALYDGAGDDEYEGPVVVQGAATANGIGLLVDQDGANRFRTSADRRGWGRAEWARSLPSIGLLLYEPERAAFERSGKPEAAGAGHAALGGPAAGTRIEHEPVHVPECPQEAPVPPGTAQPLAEALKELLPSLIASRGDPQLYAAVRARLLTDLRGSLAELPAGAFDVTYTLGEALRCVLRSASDPEAQRLWDEIERQLAATPPSRFAGALVVALRGRPAPSAQMQRILLAMAASPRCGMRATALALRDAGSPESAAAAQAGLRASCWREQAEALALLARLGAAPDPAAPIASFLRAQ
jgi:hypothetical protein